MGRRRVYGLACGCGELLHVQIMGTIRGWQGRQPPVLSQEGHRVPSLFSSTHSSDERLTPATVLTREINPI